MLVPSPGRRVGRVVARDRVHRAGRPGLPPVPDVLAVPEEREVSRRRMDAIARDDRLRRRAARARRIRPRADQTVEERRARLGLGRRADAHEAVTALQDVGERALLFAVEAVAVGMEDHDRAVVVQPPAGEPRRVLRRVDPEAAPGTELLDRREAGARPPAGERGSDGRRAPSAACRLRRCPAPSSAIAPASTSAHPPRFHVDSP